MNTNTPASPPFRAMIEARLATLAEDDRRGQDGQAIVTLDQQAVGRLNRMDALQNQAMSKANASRRHTEAGEYGWCDDCGEAIPEGRLRLDLAATRCVSCASG